MPDTWGAGIARGIRFETLLLALVVATIALTACLLPAQNDSWWHLRAGQWLWQHGAVPLRDAFSYTAAGRAWPNHEWLWQAATYPLFIVGGLPLLTVAAAAVITGAYTLALRLMEGGARLRFAVMAIGLPLSSGVWALRPQVASLLCLALLLAALVHGRFRLVPPLFVLWANLHGAVALGGAVMLAAVLAAALWDRRKLPSLAIVTVLSGLATAVTPLGIGLWRFIAESIGRSSAVQINEWKPVDLRGAEGIAFYLLAVAFVALVVVRRHRLVSWADRLLVVAALILLPLAARYVRNVPPFLLAAMPAATRLLGRADTPGKPPAASPDHPRLNLAILSVFVALGVGGVAWAWSMPWSQLGWRPISPAAVAAIDACPTPIYNRYDDGGTLIWFTPRKPVFIDSRQDPYPPDFVAAHVRDENRGEYRETFMRWGIRCAVLPPESPTLRRLRADGWREIHRDEQWSVLTPVSP